MNVSLKNHIVTTSVTVEDRVAFSLLVEDVVELDLTTQIATDILTVTSLEPISNKTVYYSASQASVLALLGSEAVVNLSDSSSITVPVNWESSYNAYALGTYEFIGTIELPEGVSNPGDLEYQVDVTVSSINIQSITNPAEQDIAINSTALQAAATLPTNITVTLEHPIDGDNQLTLPANWDTSGGSPFDASDIGETRLLGFPNYPSYITNTGNIEVEALFNVIFVYMSIAAAPSFTSPATVIDTAGSSLENSETGGAADILIAGNAIPNLYNNRFRPNAISNRRFKSAGSSRVFVGGQNVTTGMQVIAPLNGSDNLKYYHIGIIGNSNTSQQGISGFNHLASVAGTRVEAHDVIIKDVYFAGILINEGTAGEHYADIVLKDVRVFGHPQDGELIYIGYTTDKLVNYSPIHRLEIYNFYGTNKGKDGLQLTHIANGVDAICAMVEKGTIYDVGKANVSLQRLLAQIHNTNGYCKKYIFHKAPEPINIFTHGFTFEDCYFEWDTDAPIYAGRLKASDAFGASALAGNGQPVTFRRCIFNPSVNQTRLMRWLETDCNYVFEDCYFNNRIAAGNVANFFSDERTGSPTNTLSNTGYTIGPPLASPTYTNHDPAQEDTHGLLTSKYYYNLKMGFRTPD